MSQNIDLKKSHGVTLIELMIGIAIGLLIISSVMQAFISTKHAIRNQENLNQVQERTRFANFLITRSAMMADHWGAINWNNISGALPSVTGMGDCNQAWIFNGDEHIRGYDGQADLSSLTGSANNPFPENCLPNYKANTDIIVVRYVDGNAVADSNLQSDEIYLRVAQGRRGQFFLGSQLSNLPSDLYVAGEPSGKFNYPYKIEAYYIRECYAYGVGKSECDATADNNRPIPTLMRATLQGTTFVHELLIEGIEHISFEYGIDPEHNGIANCWLSATSVSNSNNKCNDMFGTEHSVDWSQVTSIRMSLLGRTLDGDGSFTDSNTYSMAGGDFNAPANVDNFRRRVVSKVVQLRNATRG